VYEAPARKKQAAVHSSGRLAVTVLQGSKRKTRWSDQKADDDSLTIEVPAFKNICRYKMASTVLYCCCTLLQLSWSMQWLLIANRHEWKAYK
jgi:hypothetical protein